MDHHIQGLKSFIDGLGSRNVAFPQDLTPQEINLIIELFITAAHTETKGTINGFEKLFGALWSRIYEDLGADSAQDLLKTLPIAK